MKRKIIIPLVIIMIILCNFQYVYADEQSTNVDLYYKDTDLGILAYKQISAFKVTLADGSTLADASISTNSQLDIVENLKKVEIVFVIDTSGSMSGTRETTTRDSTKTLVQSLFEKLGAENLKIGVIYFNSTIDITKILDLTSDENQILQHLDLIYASGGTKMATSLEKAKEMLKGTENNGIVEDDQTIKIVCTLSDGALADESESIEKFKQIHESGISTISIFVETPITSVFSALATENIYHKNFQTSTANLANTIVKDIYNEIYIRIIMMSDPKTVYNMNNAGIIFGDDKIIFQVDEELLHGATLEIEYVISITTAFDCNNIKINDFFSEDLVFSKDQKLLTEDKKNSDYGWRIEGGILTTDSGSQTIQGADEYKVKLNLSTVFTPTRLRDLNKIGNYMEFSLNKIDENKTIVVKDNYGNSENHKIKALDFLIIPPTGRYIFMQNVVLTLNMTVIVISVALMIICIRDYIKTNKVSRKK